jgi:dihydroorotase
MPRILLLLGVAAGLSAQTYDLLLQGGHVIDPANQIDGAMDVAITGNRVARVAARIPTQEARKTVDVSGLYVTPGLIDLHAHVFGYEGTLFPDDTSLVTGATTVVDAGGSGWRTFDSFRHTIIEKSRTRVLVLINIVGWGMKGPRYENNTEDMDSTLTAGKIKQNRDVIVGIKTAHFGGYGWTAIDRAVGAGRLADVPVMVDDHIFTNSGRNSRDKLLDHLRPGDMHTHTFNDRQVEIIDRFTGKVQPYVWEARRRGVLFDMGHGAGSFLWPAATRATAQGFYPDTISTDLHAESIMMQQSDMPNCITKMLSLGMSLQDAILRSTVNPAKNIHRFPELGTLSQGAVADVAVLTLKTGVFALKDAWAKKRMATEKLENIMTVRNGRIVYDVNGLAFPVWTSAAAQGRSE